MKNYVRKCSFKPGKAYCSSNHRVDFIIGTDNKI